MKDSFILYQEQKEIFDSLTDNEAGKLIKAIFEYESGQSPKLNKTLSLVFIPIKNALDRNRQKYEAQVEKNRENGKKGGRPKKANESEDNPNNPSGFLGNPTKAKKADNDNEHDNDSEYDNEHDSDLNNKKNNNIFKSKLYSDEEILDAMYGGKDE